MVTRVNGGIINNQTLTGKLRFFKIAGPFAWTVSDGSVNLPQSSRGGAAPATTYYTVGRDAPVPNSAAESAIMEISRQADVVIIGVQPATYGATTEIHIACSASAFGWGSGTPTYGTNVDENLTAAAPEMQVAIRALGTKIVHVSVGAPGAAKSPVTASANLALVTVTEVPFRLV